MSKYIIPVCFIEDDIVLNEVIVAKSILDCQDKLMEKYSEYLEYSSEFSYHDFVNELKDNNILIGKIIDIEEL